MICACLTDIIIVHALGFETRQQSASERTGVVEVCFGVQDDSAPLVGGLNVTIATQDIGCATGEP